MIQADIEDRAPQQTESGLLVAKTLAAAVEGSDTEDSWFVGTVVALGPLVNRFDVRPWVTKEISEWKDKCVGERIDAFLALEVIESHLGQLPAECPDPLHFGDRVTFSWAAGQQITVDGTKYLIMRQRDVLAVLDPDESE